ncbi:MAG: type II toxin-antitoxin system RelE/ParE family toxin [SAR324 cluster bacterium]
MIASFGDKDTQKLAEGKPVARFRAIAVQARRRLYLLELAAKVEHLAIPRGNRLERLGGNREGQWSIRINDQWRICFEWRGASAYNVQIVDYH